MELSEEVKSNHTPILSKMSYLAAHAEAEKRLAEGQLQKQCPKCRLYYFPDEYGEPIESIMVTNFPDKIYLMPNLDGKEGVLDFSEFYHEFNYFLETR
jgi:hypothetical protein